MQKIKFLWLRQRLCLCHAFGKGLPGYDGLDSSKRIITRLLGVDQHLADTAEQAHLGIDRLPGCLELFLMSLLGIIEQLAQDAVMQINNFICDGGHPLDS